MSHWLKPYALAVKVAPGIAPKVVSGMSTALPSVWEQAANVVTVHHLDLEQGGYASLFVEGERAEVQKLICSLGDAVPASRPTHRVRCRVVRSYWDEPAVTRRQHQVLASAVAAGYYEIPHCLDMRELAIRLGLSLGSVSELLRRAERGVIESYIDGGAWAWPLDGAALPPSPKTLDIVP
ncbi:MAG TPA: helix-turn-helix domain-containing protein [Candidatus Thermoplasmatota archaeon]|nr:helix-turn-helix domain-containing protein [Candidatus Thermoplasmatota archaeon]